MKRIRLRYLIPALRHQLPLKRLFRNYFITGNGWGLFSKYAHYNKKGNEKVGYNSLATALKSAKVMGDKYDAHFSVYRCVRCGRYHLGKNRTSVKLMNNG
jgi:hypothetical protein